MLPKSAPQRQVYYTRKQLRWFKRGQKTQAYYAGAHADPGKLEGPEADKALAARDKRARKNAKRADDAMHAAICERQAREALDGGLPRGLWSAGVYSHVFGGPVA
ncbi:hypothetical protein [Bradyrhizobium erythrophlei]|uniref:Uncharacterized protein n=1 Tax=Bradyrhizobium erythrophlei TaxID=1437360 RepID=A0A1M5NK46_9BRAD|nr:hypothetical protein [Bradyrhizobium erythrophlei]SHG89920.1 hypothetical protein SAMN05443248_3027 [Bradyrhizobium erythrophlei]